MFTIECDFKWPIGNGGKGPSDWVVVEAEGHWDSSDNSIESGTLKLSFGTSLGSGLDAATTFRRILEQYECILDYAVQALCEKAREERRSA